MQTTPYDDTIIHHGSIESNSTVSNKQIAVNVKLCAPQPNLLETRDGHFKPNIQIQIGLFVNRGAIGESL